MKSLAPLLGVCIAVFLEACGRSPVLRDVVGTWIGSDGAELVLEEGGAFSARSLPAAIFVRTEKLGPALEGKGRWNLREDSPYWEVELGFDEVWHQPGRAWVQLLVSGSGQSTSLYEFVSEEGGDRYELVRQPPKPR